MGTDGRKQRRGLTRSLTGLGVLLAVQILCAFYFISSVLSSVIGFGTAPIPWALRETLELAVSGGMILSIALLAWALVRALLERNDAEDRLHRASAAFGDLLDNKFTAWSLTPAEREVAMLAIKGFSMAEISALRQTSEGTVRAQSNAIYRKAGVTGRQQLLSYFIDEMLGQDGRAQAERPPTPAAPLQSLSAEA